MKETYGIEITAITDKFKAKMQEIQDFGTKTADRVKQAWTSTKIEPQVDKGVVTRIAELKREISTLRAEMRDTQPGTLAFESYAKAIDDADRELKELSRTQKEIKRNSSVFAGINTNIGKMGNTIKQATSRIMRYGLAILSIRTAFSLVSKSAQAYLSQDTDLAEKLQSAWAGLGAFLAPIIEWITNKIIKLVSYLNIFIKAVTGQDLLAKAAAKATKKINDQTKATKKLNKSLTEMDEITNIQKDETSGGGAGATNPFDAFDNVQLDMKWADKIKKFGEWVKNNWPDVVATLGMIGGVLAGLKLATMGGIFTKLGIILASVAVAVWALYEAFHSLQEYLKLFDKGLKDSQKGWKKFWDILKYIGIAIASIGVIIGVAVGGWVVAIVGAVVAVVSVIAKYWDQIKQAIKGYGDWLTDFTKKLFGDTLGDIIVAPFKDAVNIIFSLFNGLFKGIKQVVDGIIYLFKGKVTQGFKSIGKGLANIVIGAVNSLIDTINFTLAPIRSIIVGIGKLAGQKVTMGNIRIPKIPQLNVGTNYVPEDQLAYIHKGEAVVPKKFNSEEYFESGNAETNALLLDVNRTLLEILEKPSTFEVNGKELARTTYNDFKNEGNRLGQSSVVNVR